MALFAPLATGRYPTVGASATPGKRLRSMKMTGTAVGTVCFEGTPADLVAARSTLTGEHLAAHVGA